MNVCLCEHREEKHLGKGPCLSCMCERFQAAGEVLDAELEEG